jgi:hypothetical protein
VGLALAPLHPQTGEAVLVVVAFVALGAVGWLVYRLGAGWFGVPAGVLAAVLFLTREPVLSYGTRAYVDLPYLALVLGALVVVRRDRAPFVLLGLAGLLRPEAWLFSGALLLWRWWRWGVRWDLAVLAAAGPVLWLVADGVMTGDPLHSLTGTRENVETLGRKTGLANVPQYVPRRIGETLREPVLIGAAAGLVLTLWRTRGRALVPAVAGLLAVAAFVVLAAAGLPIITRYTFAIDAIAVAFCGAAAFGWLALDRGDPWRMRWAFAGGAVLVVLVAYAPRQAERLDATRDAIARQDAIEDDLWDLGVPGGAPLGVPNHRLVPLVSLAADVPVGDVRTPPGIDGLGFVGPATPGVARAFILDPRDPVPEVARPPRGSVPVRANDSWVLFRPGRAPRP